MRFIRAYRRSESGTVAIEAVFALPLLMAIGFGAIDGSLLMMQNHKAETGLISAGSYLAKTPTPTSFETYAKRLATTGEVSDGGERKIKNWSGNDVTINYKTIANTDTGSGRDYRGSDVIKVVQLSTSIPFEGLGFIQSISGGSVTINATYEERLTADLSS